MNFILAFGAGALTMLSPCVLPVIPLVMGAASQSSRLGPLFLLLGLITSFSIMGTFATLVLFQLGLSSDALSVVGASLLIVVGAFLWLPSLDHLFKRLFSGPAQNLEARLAKLSPTGPQGQFLVGTLIGVIWAPCTGPTLGAAIALASQGESLIFAFLTMLSFSIGTAVPLGALGYGANRWAKSRQKLMAFGVGAKKLMGLLFIGIGLAILFGWHKTLEAWVLSHLPDWWLNLITAL